MNLIPVDSRGVWIYVVAACPFLKPFVSQPFSAPSKEESCLWGESKLAASKSQTKRDPGCCKESTTVL